MSLRFLSPYCSQCTMSSMDLRFFMPWRPWLSTRRYPNGSTVTRSKLSGIPRSSLIWRFCSASLSPTKQVPSPSSHATSSICWTARPVSRSGRSAFSIATAIAIGASATNRPLDAMLPIFRSMSLSLTTTRCHGWRFRELGAHWTALSIFCTTSSGTGSGLNSRTVSRVLTASYTSTSRLL